MKSFAIGCLAFLACASLSLADDVKLGKEWQGKWQVVGLKSGDIELEEDFVKKFACSIKGTDMVWTVNDQTINAKVTFIGTEDAPRPIDIVAVGGDQDGRVYEGIYELKDDTLRLCLSTSTDIKVRPTEFVAPGGSTLVLITLRRDNP